MTATSDLTLICSGGPMDGAVVPYLWVRDDFMTRGIQAFKSQNYKFLIPKDEPQPFNGYWAFSDDNECSRAVTYILEGDRLVYVATDRDVILSND